MPSKSLFKEKVFHMYNGNERYWKGVQNSVHILTINVLYTGYEWYLKERKNK